MNKVLKDMMSNTKGKNKRINTETEIPEEQLVRKFYEMYPAVPRQQDTLSEGEGESATEVGRWVMTTLKKPIWIPGEHIELRSLSRIGYAWFYLADDRGDVFLYLNNGFFYLAQQQDEKGYLSARICTLAGVPVHVRINQIVAILYKCKGYERFKVQIEEAIRYARENKSRPDFKGFNAHHINHDRQDNRVENLELMLPEEHSFIHHLDCKYKADKAMKNVIRLAGSLASDIDDETVKIFEKDTDGEDRGLHSELVLKEAATTIKRLMKNSIIDGWVCDLNDPRILSDGSKVYKLVLFSGDEPKQVLEVKLSKVKVEFGPFGSFAS